ncbi:MAG: glycosyltransferase family 9 protein [Planctomycetota bacterium]|nr:glycosyltransferase family 9 protein [Planctomycetota bacterium]
MSLPPKVLIVRLGAIGDVVNALTLAKALKDLPQPPHIGWVVHDLARPLVEDNPLVDRVHVWSRGSGLAGYRGLIRELRSAGYGLAVDLQRLAKSALVARRSGAQRVLGWDRARSKEGAWLLVKERIQPGDPQDHMVRHYGAFAAHLGAQPTGPRGVLHPGREAEAWAAELLQGTGAAPVVLNLGASKLPNRWPAERFGELAAGLAADGLPVVLAGGPADREAAATALEVATASAGPGSAPIQDLAGATSLRQLAALLDRAALFVGCDTGPMHMAVAMGCRVVALFGPANPRRTGPFPGDAAGQRILQHLPDAASHGGKPWRAARTDAITTQEVLAAARDLLSD